MRNNNNNNNNNNKYKPGDVVLTKYGVGVIITTTNTSTNQQRRRRNENEQNNDEANVVVVAADVSPPTTTTTTTLESSNNNNDTSSYYYYTIRLWRIPGKSIASTAVAYFNESSIIRPLPIAPGMIGYINTTTTTTTTTQQHEQEQQQQQPPQPHQKVMVHCYFTNRNRYLVQTIPETDTISSNSIITKNVTTTTKNGGSGGGGIQLLEILPEQLVVSSSNVRNSAKIYPVLESVMQRAEAAASLVQQHLQTNLQTTNKVLQQAGKQLLQNSSTLDETIQQIDTATIATRTSHYLEDIQSGITNEVVTTTMNIVPSNVEENIQQVWQFMKDEEITTILEKCKDRLQTITNVVRDPTQSNALLEKSLQTIEEKAGIKILLLSDSTEEDNGDDKDDDDEYKQPTLSSSKSLQPTNQKNTKLSLTKSVEKTQRAALKAVERMLQQHQQQILGTFDENDIQAMKKEWVTNFTTVLETLQTTAKTDRILSNLVDIVTTKTSQWHEQVTGRVVQTKSGSLFMESATRLQNRAMTMLGQNGRTIFSGNNNNNNPNSIVSNLLKSFTEGDAAVARIKSIELGDVLKAKLITAIEVRSESLGGLDGIIAGALSSINTSVGTSKVKDTNTIQNLLHNLQSVASSTASNAHETLLSVLSSQSRYRDIVLLHLEQSLYDLLIVHNNTTLLSPRSKGDAASSDTTTSNAGTGDDDDEIEMLVDVDQIVALVQGEGGTKQIFEPIAKRAMEQIEYQLNLAEEQIRNQLLDGGSNNTSGTTKNILQNEKQLLLDGLHRVRKLMSGELTITALMDELVTVLNDDTIVAMGETLVQQSERVLDVIENATATNADATTSSNGADRVVREALQIAEKAGLTKESVMKELDTLNVTQFIGTAEQAVTDEKVRQQLFNDATDTALDFVLRILPSMPVPPLDGVKDGLLYTISNLSMEGFKVRKEDIQIDLAGIRATKSNTKKKTTEHSASSVSTTSASSTGAAAPAIITTTTSSSSSNEYANNDEFFDARNNSFDSNQSSSSSYTTTSQSNKAIKATELLIIDIRNISANLDNALWSFEQTYLPYLKGNGGADIKMSGGAIRLQFELRKQQRKKKTNNPPPAGGGSEQQPPPPAQPQNESNNDSTTEEYYWEPVLCLHDRTCSIADVELTLTGEGRLTWILNKLVSVFKGPLRDYVVRTIVRVLSNQSGYILKRLNNLLSPYWDLILRTAKLTLDDLVEADQQDIVEEQSAPDRTRIELVWRERLPLGMNLLMNDESGFLKVVDFPRGSAARAVCDMRKLDPDLFKGATIIAVNGRTFDDQDELFVALKDPSRPKAIQFELAKTEEVQKLLEFVEGPKKKVDEAARSASDQRQFSFRKVNFTDPGVLGIEFAVSADKIGLVVHGFLEGDDGIVLEAAKSGLAKVGDLLTHINDECVVSFDDGTDGRSKAVQLLESAATQRPLSLTFVESYMFRVAIEKPPQTTRNDTSGDGPSELILKDRQVGGVRRVYIDGFTDVSGVAESSGIFIGDHLVFLNGLPVGVGCEWLEAPNPPTFNEVQQMLKNEINYPIGLTFARPMKKQSQNRWGGMLSNSNRFTDADAETLCVVANSYDRLGCVFSQSNNNRQRQQYQYGDIVIADFLPIPGLFQGTILSLTQQDQPSDVTANLPPKKLSSIESINGEFVPSYATAEMVKNALQRSWKGTTVETTFEILLCDDDLKEWLKAQLS